MQVEQAGVEMAQFLVGMMRLLVDEPDKVSVVLGKIDGCITLDVSVAPGDVGKVIGKMGRTARSIRTILSASAKRHKVMVELTLPKGEKPQ